MKENLRVTWDAEDDLIGRYIAVAESIIQEDLDVVLQPTTYRLTLDEFPNEILIDRYPVNSVESISYTDLEGEQKTLTEDEDGTDYYVDLNSIPARIWSAVDLSSLSSSTERFWPDVLQKPGVVAVEFTAGYADQGSVPAMVKQLIHLWVAHFYQHRSPVEQGRPSKVPHSIDDLTESLRTRRLG